MGAKPPSAAPAKRTNARAGAVFFALIALVVLGTHLPLWDMPYFWDELGQFVPASLDIYQRGAWVPVSTLPNIHPPGLPALLSGVWTVFGYSITAARITMLLLASLGAFLAFLIALRLAHGVPGLPGFTLLILLLANPLFYTQSMMAQLDMPAMTLTLLALLLFLNERIVLSVVVCTVLVWTKETGAVLPAVISVFLWREKRTRDALLFLVPCLLFVPWLVTLWRTTGSIFGNREFAEFNVAYPLHPARLGLALGRRAYELMLNHGYFLGVAALAATWKRSPAFHTREFRLIVLFTLAHIAAVTVSGGAVLERYLLPVLPLVLMAYAFAWANLRGWKAIILPGAVAAISLAGFFAQPLWPQPFENNLRMVRMVDLFETAANFTERNYPAAKLAAVWPLSDALRRPEFGYVSNRRQVRTLAGFSADQIAEHRNNPPEVAIWFSADTLSDAWFFQYLPGTMEMRQQLYGWRSDVEPFYIEEQWGMREVARWSLGSQSIAVFARPR